MFQCFIDGLYSKKASHCPDCNISVLRGLSKMSKLIKFLDDTRKGHWANIMMDNGDRCWIVISRKGISIKKSRVGFFASRFYEERNIYKTAKTAETLNLLYKDNLTPDEMRTPVLKSFTNAVLYCRSLAEVVTLLHGVYHHLNRRTGDTSSGTLQDQSFLDGTIRALPLSRKAEENLGSDARSSSEKSRLKRQTKVSPALVILIFGVTIAVGGYGLLRGSALLAPQKHEASAVPHTQQLPVTTHDQRQDQPDVKLIDKGGQLKNDKTVEAGSLRSTLSGAGLTKGGVVGKTKVSVQIEAFKNERNAEALSKALQKKGYNAIVHTQEQADGTKLYRVLIGSFDNRGDAVQAAADFQAKEKRQAIIFPSKFRR
jgi:hypothetical protein